MFKINTNIRLFGLNSTMGEGVLDVGDKTNWYYSVPVRENLNIAV